ncbi:hypothetical protein TURU_003040 [Turdus rufiventris]|nr:hypothetical protein TURU_003040 [Turdus rufiventris]
MGTTRTDTETPRTPLILDRSFGLVEVDACQVTVLQVLAVPSRYGAFEQGMDMREWDGSPCMWRHGTQERVESDNGTHFQNTLLNSCAKKHHTECVYHISYNPQVSGKIERAENFYLLEFKWFMQKLLGPVIPGIYRVVFPYAIRIVIFHVTGGIIGYRPYICRQPYQADGKGVFRAGNRQHSLGVCYSPPNQEEEVDNLFYKQLENVSGSPALVLGDDLTYQTSVGNLIQQKKGSPGSF